MEFNLPKETSSIIKVIGVGGGGSNAVNHMFRQGIKGVDFIVCNTDQQALDISPVPIKIALGKNLTEGLGAGSIPEVGRNSAIESIEEIRNILAKNTKMVFITAGMGGGTGTGAAPIIAKVAKEIGILTVGIVTIPFGFEGKKRKTQAEEGMEELRKNVDTLLVICNDKLREMYGNLKLGEAFGRADDILTTAAKGIADIITTTLHINTDFADITTVMKDSGVAIMGSAQSSGEGRAVKAVENAMSSPLLNDSNIKGARYVLLNVTCGSGVNEITMDELGEITDFVQDAAGQSAEIIKGFGIDETLEDKINITIIATGFNSKADIGIEIAEKPKKIVHILDTKKQEEQPVVAARPVEVPVTKAEPIIEQPVAEITIEPTLNTTTNPLEPFLKTSETPVAGEETNTFEVIPSPLAESPVNFPVATIADSIAEVENIDNVIGQAIDDQLETADEQEISIIPVASIVNEEITTPEITAEIETPVVNDSANEKESYIIAAEPGEKQITFEFEIIPPAEPVMEAPKQPEFKIQEVSAQKSVEQPKQEEKVIIAIHNEEQIKKAQERIMKLKEMSYKVKTPSGIYEMENEPAYKRRNVELNNTPHSSESQVSRYTLSEGDDNKTEIKPNNSFLHDSVD